MTYVKCSSCNWVHMGVSRESAESSIRTFNDRYITASAETRANFGDKCASLNSYLTCFCCGEWYDKMVLATDSDLPRGSTIQPVLWLGETV